MKDLNDIKSQCQFCTELMLRLNEEVKKSNVNHCHMKDYTRKQKDIMRIRRELMELSNMLGEW
jgi:hypothetical protein